MMILLIWFGKVRILRLHKYANDRNEKEGFKAGSLLYISE